MNYIPYGRQWISEEDIQAVKDVLVSDWLTQGPVIQEFEQRVATYCGAKYAVAVNSATSALHIACLAAGLGNGERLWTSPNTFVASANCGLYCGAEVDFVDIGLRSYNMDVDELERKLIEAAEDGTLPKVLIPVHFAGQSCEMDRIKILAKKYGFTVIEDASHAVGAAYKEKKVGSCQFSDMTVFSFHPVKIITTGEGGLVLTNNEKLYQKLLLLRSHGITRVPELLEGECEGPWYYEQIDLGYNYRITDIQAALGLSQMKRLDEFVGRRHELADRYNEGLQGLPVVSPWQHEDAYSSFHLYVIRLNTGKIKKTRRQVFEELRQGGIGVNVHYIPVHTQPYYKKLGFKADDFPSSVAYYREAITLPLYPGLLNAEQDYVVETLKEILR